MDDLDGKLPGRCAAIGASSWSDALNDLVIDGVLQDIKQRSGPICAFAATARQVPGRLSDFDESDFAAGRLVAATGPGKAGSRSRNQSCRAAGLMASYCGTTEAAFASYQSGGIGPFEVAGRTG